MKKKMIGLQQVAGLLSMTLWPRLAIRSADSQAVSMKVHDSANFRMCSQH